MTSAPSMLILGFLLGMRHATDPDHVVAVTTIVARERRAWAAAIIGAWWGLGHTITIFVVGGAIISFHLVIPPRLGLAMESAVALMLVGLGITTLKSVSSGATHARVAHRSNLRSLFVGTVHGLAGSAAIALLILVTISDARWSALYLAVFGVGTIAGMTVLTTLLALPFSYTAERFASANAALVRVTAAASVLLGVFLAYRFVVKEGLLSSAPHWTPG
jgi:high-affinity nickel-transport protein